MLKNQDTMRMHASFEVGKFKTHSSVLMLPVRLETRFMNRTVVKTHNEDAVLFIFQALWSLVDCLQSKDYLLLEYRVSDVYDLVERQQIVYKEDKNRVLDVMRNLTPFIPATESGRWKEAVELMEHCVAVEKNKYNRASQFLKDAGYIRQRVFDVLGGLPFCGRQRTFNNPYFSNTIHMRTMTKRIREILDFSDSMRVRISEIPYLDKKQYGKATSVLFFMRDYKKDNKRWDFKDNIKEELAKLRDPRVRDRKNKNELHVIDAYCEAMEKFLAWRASYSPKQYLRTLKSKIREGSRYTLLFYSVLCWRIHNKFADSIQDKTQYDDFSKIASKCYFEYSEEYQWMYEHMGGRFFDYRFLKKRELNDKESKTKYFRRHKMSESHDAKCLCVRIYPDELCVTQMLKNPTEEDLDYAKRFVDSYFAAGEDDVARRAAWDRLCKEYPPYQAAWIVRCYQQKVPACNDKREIFTIPVSQLLPTRFMIQATLKINNSRDVTIRRYGNRVPDTLQAGFNFNEGCEPEIDQYSEYIKFLDGLKWMTDYGEAEKMGMAITIPLDEFKFGKYKKPRKFEFKSIYVTGIREDIADRNENPSVIIEKLLQSHLYSEKGLDMLTPGTPTNILNDSDDRIYDTSVQAMSDRYFALVENAIDRQDGWNCHTERDSDALVINRLLGLDDYTSPLSEVAGNRKGDLDTIKKMQGALIDYFAMVGGNTFLNKFLQNGIWRDFLTNYVLAQGVYPVMRIGDQPYGILPVGDFSCLYFSEGDPLKPLFDIIMSLTKHWNRIAESNVIYDGNSKETLSTTITGNFLKAVGKTPSSTTFSKCKTVELPFFLDPYYFKGRQFDTDPLSEFKPYQDSTNFSTFASIPISDENYSKEISFDEAFQGASSFLFNKFKGADPVIVEEAITGFFDLFSYRLDAWLEGMLCYRLDKLIGRGEHSIALGAYGMVFDLKEDKLEPVSGEYILAPSVNQAITAAVLRSAYNKGTEGNELCVNLSSSRVRKAKRVIAGVRNGLSVGAVLGSDFERLLHDAFKTNGAELDKFIFPLRKRFPLDAKVVQGKDDVREPAVFTTTVINAAAMLSNLRSLAGSGKKTLYDTFYNGRTLSTKFKDWCIEWGWLDGDKHKRNIFDSSQDQKNDMIQLLYCIQEVFDTYDALTDVVLSESVYKLCEGNRDAVTALMQCMQQEKGIPMPDVTEVPYDCARIEYRALAALRDASVTCANSFLQMADPSMDAWMGMMLGLDNCPALMRLGITPSEIVYLSANEGFETWLVTMSGGDRTCLEDYAGIEFAVDSMRSLLTTTHALTPKELIAGSPKREVPDGVDYDELEGRFSALYNKVVALRNDMNDLAAVWTVENESAEETAGKVADRSNLLMQCCRLGMMNAFDVIEVETPDQLLPTLVSIASMLSDRISKVDDLLREKKEKNNLKAVTYQDAVRILTVKPFILVPSLKVDRELVNVDDLRAQQFGNPFKNVQDDLTIDEWISQMADVRPAMQHLNQLKMFGAWNFSANPLSYRPMQLPFGIDESTEHYWLGLEVDANDPEKFIFNANAYLVLDSEAMFMDREFTAVKGIVFDIWNESIPYRNQTAGLAFAYDQPDAEPPQVMMLALPENFGNSGRWTERKLLRSIKSAMHLVKDRAVEPDHLMADPWTAGVFPMLNVVLPAEE